MPSPYSQNDNSSLTETVARLRAEHTVLFQKRRRLEAQLEDQNKELKSLQGGMVRLNVDLQRVNGLIAQNSSAREALKVREGGMRRGGETLLGRREEGR